jgi:hypothetical protein
MTICWHKRFNSISSGACGARQAARPPPRLCGRGRPRGRSRARGGAVGPGGLRAGVDGPEGAPLAGRAEGGAVVHLRGRAGDVTGGAAGPVGCAGRLGAGAGAGPAALWAGPSLLTRTDLKAPTSRLLT